MSTPNPKETRRPCGCSFNGGWPRFTADWHRRHQEHHLAEFPDVDQNTKDNLAMFIKRAEQLVRENGSTTPPPDAQ